MQMGLQMTNGLSELLPFLTPHERAEIDQLILSRADSHPAWGDFTTFKRHLYKRYEHPAHLERLDRALTDISRWVETGGREGIYMLIAEMPPRHGKTLTVSRLFPPWHLGRNPDHRIMLVSYGATLAHKNSRHARSVMNAPLYEQIFGVTLNPASRAVDAWDIDAHEGGSDALGVLGGATGKGAHILICDDLIKNRQDAESDVIRDRTWDALNDDLLTRQEPGGAIIMFATRWHMDDPIGRMLRLVEEKPMPGPVVHLRFPAIAEEHDDLGRTPGEALWPERYPRHILENTRDRMGQYSWNALYQQSPTPAEGGLFKRASFRLIDRLPRDDELEYVGRYWDLAMSEKDSADYSVGVKMARGLDGRTKVLDVARKQLEWGDVPGFMAETALRDGPGVVIGFEEKGYMSRAGQALAADTRLHQYGIFGYPKDKDKRTNALPFAARVSLKMVDVMDAHWTRDYLDELCSFPYSAHDDQVDASAGAYEMLGLDVFAGGLHHAAEYEIGSGAY